MLEGWVEEGLWWWEKESWPEEEGGKLEGGVLVEREERSRSRVSRGLVWEERWGLLGIGEAEEVRSGGEMVVVVVNGMSS